MNPYRNEDSNWNWVSKEPITKEQEKLIMAASVVVGIAVAKEREECILNVLREGEI